MAVANRQSASSAIVLAVSQTSLGFDKDWIVVTTNMFSLPGGSAPFHANLYVINKANAYAGGNGSLTRISTPNSNSGNIAPACTFDPT